jgi:hypothetical protein
MVTLLGEKLHSHNGKTERREILMKRIGMKMSMLIMASSLTGGALAADGTIFKDRSSKSSNYCHEQFSAISPSAIASDNPEPKSQQSGDKIDYYGPCNESPTGADQVQAQKLEQSHHYTQSIGQGF